MGSPKALLDVAGIPWVCAHVRAFAAVKASVTVVVGSSADEVRAVLPTSVRVVENSEWETTDTARSAFLGLQGCDRAFVTPVDAPPCSAQTLRALLEAGAASVPTFAGKDGHPILLFPPHHELRLDERTRSAARVRVHDPDCILNLNTRESYDAWRAGWR